MPETSTAAGRPRVRSPVRPVRLVLRPALIAPRRLVVAASVWWG